MASQRELRGIDATRLRVVLVAMQLTTLRHMLLASQAPTSGAKDDFVQVIHRLIETGRKSIRAVLANASEIELESACSNLGLDDSGSMAELIDKIDCGVRYAPLGNASTAAAALIARVDPTLDDRARLFVIEIHAGLADGSRECNTLALGELIGRLGWRRAEFRARAAAGREVGEVLWMNGVATEPDLMALTTSPGVDAEITLRLRTDWGQGAAPNAPRQETDSALAEFELAESVAELGMGISRVDQVVHERELACVRKRAAESIRGAGLDERRRLDDLVLRLSSVEIDVEEAARRVAARFTIKQRSELFEHLFEVAIADAVIVKEEMALLRRLEIIIGPAAGLLDSLLAGVRHHVAPTHATDPTAPSQETERVELRATSGTSAVVDAIMDLLFA